MATRRPRRRVLLADERPAWPYQRIVSATAVVRPFALHLPVDGIEAAIGQLIEEPERLRSDDDLGLLDDLGTSLLVSSDNFLGRIGDSRKDRRLEPRVGKEAPHRTRADAIGGLSDGSR